MGISALSKDAFHLTSVINQRGSLLLARKVTADHWKTHKINYLFTVLMRWDLGIMGWCAKANLYQLHLPFLFFYFFKLCFYYFVEVGREGSVCNKRRQIPLQKTWTEKDNGDRIRLLDLCWQKQPPCHKHFSVPVPISPLVTSGKAIPVGQRGERGEEKLREWNKYLFKNSLSAWQGEIWRYYPQRLLWVRPGEGKAVFSEIWKAHTPWQPMAFPDTANTSPLEWSIDSLWRLVI